MCIEAQVLFEYYMHKFFSQAKFFNHLLCSFCISQEMESSTKKCIFPPKSFEVINPKQWGKIYKQCKILISYFNSKLWFAEVKILNIFIQRNLPLRHGINETNNSWAQNLNLIQRYRASHALFISNFNPIWNKNPHQKAMLYT